VHPPPLALVDVETTAWHYPVKDTPKKIQPLKAAKLRSSMRIQ
jgi:hypothetical protein